MLLERLFARPNAPTTKAWLRWNTQYMIAALGIASFILPAVCDSVEDLQKRQNTGYHSPSSQANPALFHHRAHHSSIVSGGFLWIHGGEITTWNGTGSGFGTDTARGDLITLPSNYTYSVDLSSSWTNATVGLVSSDSKAPILINQALWLDPSRTSFYAYDGGLSYSLQLSDQPPPPVNQLWQFRHSGKSGNWSQVSPAASSIFPTFERAMSGIYASGGGLGFALGGSADAATNTNIQGAGTYPIPGMIMYNITSQEWYNVSATGYSVGGIAADGAAHFVPSFGPAGLLFVFGGTVANGVLPGTNTISMLEPVSQQWSTQAVSGTNPLAVTNPCVVGAPSGNDTYEIFLYGGRAAAVEDTIAQGVVYVLSLPAFHWVKHNVTSKFGRYAHTCNVVANRQMVSVGGRVVNAVEGDLETGDTPDGGIPDPWHQGLGIFDMTAMEWKESYDPRAGGYITPAVIRSYYQQNGRYPSSWTDPKAQTWFTTSNSNPTSANSTASSNTNSSHGGGGPSNTGAIAGGIIGGVAALAIIALLTFFLLRRRRRSRETHPTPPPPQDPEYHKPELAGNNNTDDGLDRAKFGGATNYSELPPHHVLPTASELPAPEGGGGAGVRHELQAA